MTGGKLVRRHELARLYSSGRQVAESILGLDVTGMDVDATGLVWDTGDADMVCRPVAGTLTPVTWLPVPSAQLMLTMFERDGTPAPADPRHALVRSIGRLQSLGFSPVLACELEFYLLHPDTLQPAGGGRTSERQKIDAYSLTRLDDLAPLFADVFAAFTAQSLPAETLMSEYAAGQFEITLAHRRDALRAVDEAILFKRLLRRVASRHGLLATFMAKPFAERAGSGLYLHVSLERHGGDAGTNLCAADDPAGSAVLRHMVGGLRRTMAESFAIFAPNANSYRRFQSASYAAYVDLEADVLPRLTLGIAARFEDYSSFGSKTVGKVQARFEVSDAIALRATASTGFHAPSPGQSNVETLSTTFTPGTTTQVQIGTYRVTSAIAQFYGATTLDPEESTNLSAGIVFTPIEDLIVTVDAYRIEVDNRIGISQQFTVTQADIDALADLSYVGLGGTVQYFTNGFDTKTKGLDVVGTYEFGVGPGRLTTMLAYNYNKSTVPSFDPLVITPARIVDIEHYAPNDRVNLNLDYDLDRFHVLLRGNYYGTFRNEQDYAGQLFSAKTTIDAEFTYWITDQITASIGGRNILDEYPDVIDGVNALTGGLGDGERYPRTGGPFGYNGAFFYARVGMKF